jgi:hypothetical protein
MSSDDVGDAVGRADLDEVAEDAEDIDEDRSWRDKSPFAVWLLFVFGLPTVVFLLGFVTGQFQFDVTIAATIDISAAAQEALRWLVRLVIFFTAMSILVLLPGDYLAMVLRALDGFSYQEDDDDE